MKTPLDAVLELISAAYPVNADGAPMHNAYSHLFGALTLVNWVRGGTLGAAWYMAGCQVASFAMGLQNSSLVNIANLHRDVWARQSVTHPHRDDMLALDAAAMVFITEYATRQVRAALDELHGLADKSRGIGGMISSMFHNNKRVVR